jgi:hypothetical protein
MKDRRNSQVSFRQLNAIFNLTGKIVGAAIIIYGINACALAHDNAEKHVETVPTYGAQIGIVNHTNRYIYSATVDGSGGGHSESFNAGIGNICCATLPEKWSPGLKVSITWDMPVGREHVYKTKVVNVEKYDTPGSLYLHFFRTMKSEFS